MELNNFINEIASKIREDLNRQQSRMMLQDIIMIYNGCYNSYENYLDTMIKGNERIDEFNERQNAELSPFIKSTYYIKHIIIEKEDYDFIKSLSLLYNKVGSES